jgi:hypothetical protein
MGDRIRGFYTDIADTGFDVRSKHGRRLEESAPHQEAAKKHDRPFFAVLALGAVTLATAASFTWPLFLEDWIMKGRADSMLDIPEAPSTQDSQPQPGSVNPHRSP